MSIEAAAAFKQLATEDAGLQAEVLAAAEAGGMTAVAALAAGRGYAFSPADAEAALAPAAGELSELELEAVAGGKTSTRASASSRGRSGNFIIQNLLSQANQTETNSRGIAKSTDSIAGAIGKV